LLPELVARTSRKPEILLGLSEKRNFTRSRKVQGVLFVFSWINFSRQGEALEQGDSLGPIFSKFDPYC
jgi:hypothetical protein